MRRQVLFLVIMVVIAAIVYLIYSFIQSGPLPSNHVLLITLDTTRADYLGCYQPGKSTSPHLDRLALQSVVFDRAIAQAAVTPVSHASILTGLEPYNHGLRVLHGLVANRLGEEHKTLPEVWKEVGGQTAAFVSAFPVTQAFGLHQGFDFFDAAFPPSDGKWLRSHDGVLISNKSQRRADYTATAAISWLKAQAVHDKPLLMWVHFFDPHDPLVLPPKGIHHKFRTDSKNHEEVLRAIYACEVFFMDSQIGRLFQAYKDCNMWDNTIVVVVADHGEGLGDHNWWSHGILYQEQIRVPQIVRIPGLQGGARISSLVRTIDLMPTILEAADIDADYWPEMDGQSLLETMRSGQAGQQLTAYADSINILTYPRLKPATQVDHKDDKLYCLMKGNYKLIYHQLQPDQTEFYDLAHDPRELHNLAPSNPQEMKAMIADLMSLDALSDIMPGMTQTDTERFEQLKSLGYVE